MRKPPSSVADLRRSSARDIIRRPLVTEKTMQCAGDNKYTFEVVRDANKLQIRDAVQQIFGVTVTKVTTTRMPGKLRRRGKSRGYTPDWKKAVVTLKDGDTIEVDGAPLFEV